jgi:hypothetical protein
VSESEDIEKILSEAETQILSQEWTKTLTDELAKKKLIHAGIVMGIMRDSLMVAGFTREEALTLIVSMGIRLIG